MKTCTKTKLIKELQRLDNGVFNYTNGPTLTASGVRHVIYAHTTGCNDHWSRNTKLANNHSIILDNDCVTLHANRRSVILNILKQKDITTLAKNIINQFKKIHSVVEVF